MHKIFKYILICNYNYLLKFNIETSLCSQFDIINFMIIIPLYRLRTYRHDFQ